jgi:hypothetical protein
VPFGAEFERAARGESPLVTTSRLAYCLREPFGYAVIAIVATQVPLGKMDGILNPEPPTDYSPNAETNKPASRETAQAQMALANALQHLSSALVLTIVKVGRSWPIHCETKLRGFKATLPCRSR